MTNAALLSRVACKAMGTFLAQAHVEKRAPASRTRAETKPVAVPRYEPNAFLGAEAAAALEEAVGCFSRAADVARRAWGTKSVRCAELEAREAAFEKKEAELRMAAGACRAETKVAEARCETLAAETKAANARAERFEQELSAAKEETRRLLRLKNDADAQTPAGAAAEKKASSSSVTATTETEPS